MDRRLLASRTACYNTLCISVFIPHLQGVVDVMLSTLDKRERNVLRLRYGLLGCAGNEESLVFVLRCCAVVWCAAPALRPAGVRATRELPGGPACNALLGVQGLVTGQLRCMLDLLEQAPGVLQHASCPSAPCRTQAPHAHATLCPAAPLPSCSRQQLLGDGVDGEGSDAASMSLGVRACFFGFKWLACVWLHVALPGLPVPVSPGLARCLQATSSRLGC